ncbi:MAG: DUF362 domain-containing protein [Candidatus Bipolaricaulaceae bacterium]
MGTAKVAVIKAGGYASDQLRPAVERALATIGGLEGLIPRGARVFVKVNHLPPPSAPEKGIVTHPDFAEAVIAQLREATPHVAVGDDVHDGGEDGFSLSRYRQMCARTGARLVNLREQGFVEVPCGGRVLDRIYLAREVVEADVVVNLPKLKTHTLTLLTGAVKNLYGVIPAGLRSAFHGEYKELDRFGQVLVDVFSAVKPVVSIMDAVVAMEGDGPANGAVRPVGAVLASRDAVALDAVAAQLMGVDPWRVITTRLAHEQGVGVGELAEIEIAGTPLSELTGGPFVLPTTAPTRILDYLPRPVARVFARQLVARPRVSKDRCVGCGACARICPTGAAAVVSGKARIYTATCIRCMCCHEACRFGAVILRRPPAGAVIHGLVRVGRRLTARSG